MPYKAKNWDGLSHEQYFSIHRFLDILLLFLLLPLLLLFCYENYQLSLVMLANNLIYSMG